MNFALHGRVEKDSKEYLKWTRFGIGPAVSNWARHYLSNLLHINDRKYNSWIDSFTHRVCLDTENHGAYLHRLVSFFTQSSDRLSQVVTSWQTFSGTTPVFYKWSLKLFDQNAHHDYLTVFITVQRISLMCPPTIFTNSVLLNKESISLLGRMRTSSKTLFIFKTSFISPFWWMQWPLYSGSIFWLQTLSNALYLGAKIQRLRPIWQAVWFKLDKLKLLELLELCLTFILLRTAHLVTET